MQFLFLDTETSALSPNKGQIIEMAGVLAQLDPTTLELKIQSQFEELVELRSQELDERVVRITGITETDLKSAKSLTQVQSRWAEWLEKNAKKEVYVVGHSVEFDLAFLRAESWFLPLNHRELDTLALAKVLLPDASAINLEYLAKKYRLSPEDKKSQTTGELVAHRALYDTYCCFHLFEFCLTRLEELQAAPEFYEQFKIHFNLPQLNFYGTGITTETSPKPLLLQTLRFDGQLARPGLGQKIAALGTKAQEAKLKTFLRLDVGSRLRLVLLQSHTLILLGSRSVDNLKFHARDELEFAFFETLLEQLLALDTETAETVYLERFENLTTQVRSLSERQFSLTKLVAFLEIYCLLVPNSLPIQQVTSAYDFFLITLQPFWIRSEFVYKPFDLKPQETVIRSKIIALNQALQELYRYPWSLPHELAKAVVDSIKKLLNDLQDEPDRLLLRSNAALIFRYHRHQLYVVQKDPQWRLNPHLEKVLQEHEPVITTNLAPKDFQNYLELTGTKRVLDTYSRIRFPEQNPRLSISGEDPKLSEFFKARLQIAKETNKPGLILCGQNSGLRDGEKVLPQGDFDRHDYLILGDTGSLTKIGSKLTQGFGGIVLVKTGDFEYLARLGLLSWSEIWILAAPYLTVDNYWWKLAKASGRRDEWLKMFKFMHLQNIAARVFALTKQEIRFQKAYRL